MMHRRKVLVAISLFLSVVTAIAWLAWPKRARPVLPVRVTAYHRNTEGLENFILADTDFQIPAGYCVADPHLEVSIQTSKGWRRIELVTMGPPTPLRMQPGGHNRTVIMLPADTVNWRLLVSGREAGLRSRFSYHLGSWARDDSFNLRPGWLWLCRTLSNDPGAALQLRSNVLPVRDKGQSRPLHNDWVQTKPSFAFPLVLGLLAGTLQAER